MLSHKKTIPRMGENVAAVCKKYPMLQKMDVINQSYEIYHPGKKIAIFLFTGGRDRDFRKFTQGKLFSELYDSGKYTLIFFNWEKYLYIPELVYAQIEDLLEQEKIRSLFVYGASCGGFCANEFMIDLFRKRIPINLKGLITVINPYDISDFVLYTREKFILTRLINLIIGSTMFMTPLKHPRECDSFRKYYSNLPVLSLTSSGFDALVNTQQGAKKMQRFFRKINVKILKGEPLIRHEAPKLHKKINLYFSHLIGDSQRNILREEIRLFLKRHS